MNKFEGVPRTNIYYPNDDQFTRIHGYLRFDPQWFILGGPCDCYEMEYFKRLQPGGRGIMVEPNPHCYELQRSRNKWKLGDVSIFHRALWSEDDLVLPFHCPPPGENVANSTLIRRPEWPTVEVTTITLDYLNGLLGPFTNSLLWLDCEGAEYEIVKGGHRLLSSGEVKCMNVEFCHEEREEEQDRLHELILSYGFELVRIWNDCHTSEDRIYKLKGVQ